MTIHMRPYAGAADLQRILDLKRTCTTPENRYDTPIFSELLALLAPLPQDPAAGRPPWEDEQGRAIGHHHRRALAQQATMLWEENDDRLLAYALVAPPSTALTFQVHPQARDSGLETQILTWAITGAQEQARRRGGTFSLWCRCHEHETGRRALLEEAGFTPLPARDLRLVCTLDISLPAAHLPAGFVLRGGVHGGGTGDVPGAPPGSIRRDQHGAGLPPVPRLRTRPGPDRGRSHRNVSSVLPLSTH